MSKDTKQLTQDDWRQVIANQQNNPPPPREQPYQIAYDPTQSSRQENGFFLAVFGPNKK